MLGRLLHERQNHTSAQAGRTYAHTVHGKAHRGRFQDPQRQGQTLVPAIASIKSTERCRDGPRGGEKGPCGTRPSGKADYGGETSRSRTPPSRTG